jgi:hypothetical protein
MEHSPNKHNLYLKDGFPRPAPPPVEVGAAFEGKYMVTSKRLYGAEVVANEEGTHYRDSRGVGAGHIHNPEEKANMNGSLNLSRKEVYL